MIIINFDWNLPDVEVGVVSNPSYFEKMISRIHVARADRREGSALVKIDKVFRCRLHEKLGGNALKATKNTFTESSATDLEKELLHEIRKSSIAFKDSFKEAIFSGNNWIITPSKIEILQSILNEKINKWR